MGEKKNPKIKIPKNQLLAVFPHSVAIYFFDYVRNISERKKGAVRACLDSSHLQTAHVKCI